MDNKTYLEKAMITNDGKSLLRLDDAILKAPLKAQMIHASLGLTGEAGEVADLMKKHIFHEKDREYYQLERLWSNGMNGIPLPEQTETAEA